MNWEYMKRNVGSRVQLVPMACRLDEYDRELPPIDDEWIVEGAVEDGVPISNVRTDHGITLGRDHIHHFTSNPDGYRDGIERGFLTLHVQVFLQGTRCWVRPNARPGEPVKVQPLQIAEKCVDFRYPFESGIQQRIETAGYRLAWCLDTNLTRKIELEGWEIVVEPDARGVPTKFRVKDRPADQILVRRRIKIS